MFLFWTFFGLVSVELPFEAVLGTFFDHVSLQTSQRLIKEATALVLKKSHSAIRRNTEPVSRKASSIQDHLTEI